MSFHTARFAATRVTAIASPALRATPPAAEITTVRKRAMLFALIHQQDRAGALSRRKRNRLDDTLSPKVLNDLRAAALESFARPDAGPAA
ncbi:hypothetical protein R5H30_00775 [Sulfitobacter sp. D35]|uniref:hypothetical protein n=1 Tax=Sulfitobacter sp. D35 TaxID=3083252 RepID=UPI00296F688E|nr:hypothetical protein [Sulfitobacter sp. D35]MDW4496498.1 hypothetical protein [Sulfitobacter sp. D35]